MTKSRTIAASLTTLSLGLWLGCGVNRAPNPFSTTGDGGAGGGNGGEGGVFVGAGGGSGGDDAGPPVDPTLGGPCVDDGQCDDGDACTLAGVCQGGNCTKGPPIDCSVFDSQCTVGVCTVGVGCTPQPTNEAGACDDGKASPCSLGKCAAGVYYIQIDGFNLDKGAWFLDVRVVDP